MVDIHKLGHLVGSTSHGNESFDAFPTKQILRNESIHFRGRLVERSQKIHFHTQKSIFLIHFQGFAAYIL